MEIKQFTSGIETLKQSVASTLGMEEFYQVDEPGYSYTVGMDKVGLPEFVIEGRSAEEAKELFGLIYKAAQHKIIRAGGTGGTIPVVAGGLLVEKMNELAKRKIFFAKRIHHGSWDFAAAKLRVKETCDGDH